MIAFFPICSLPRLDPVAHPIPALYVSYSAGIVSVARNVRLMRIRRPPALSLQRLWGGVGCGRVRCTSNPQERVTYSCARAPGNETTSDKATMGCCVPHVEHL